MEKVFINFCKVADLMRVPGIGNILAQRILSFREDRNITPDLFPTITGVRNVPELIKYFDFTPFGNQSQSSAIAKEGEVLRTSEEARYSTSS